MMNIRRWVFREEGGPYFKCLKIGYMESHEIKIEMEEGKENGQNTPATVAMFSLQTYK